MKNPPATSGDWIYRPFIDYLCEVDRLLYEQYGITSDNLDRVAAAQEDGDTPQEHVDWLADHDDLCPLGGRVAK